MTELPSITCDSTNFFEQVDVSYLGSRDCENGCVVEEERFRRTRNCMGCGDNIGGEDYSINVEFHSLCGLGNIFTQVGF